MYLTWYWFVPSVLTTGNNWSPTRACNESACTNQSTEYRVLNTGRIFIRESQAKLIQDNYMVFVHTWISLTGGWIVMTQASQLKSQAWSPPTPPPPRTTHTHTQCDDIHLISFSVLWSLLCSTPTNEEVLHLHWGCKANRPGLSITDPY